MMTMISYRETTRRVPVRTYKEIAVLVVGKLVGYIRAEKNGWRYHPAPVRHGLAGELFPTLDACKRSLEEDDSE